MIKFAVYLARMAACGFLALAATACMRLAPAEGWLARAEPHSEKPPNPEEHAPTVSEQERVEALEKQVADLNADLGHLRKALEVMGPLPEARDHFIPVADAPQRSKITIDEFGAGIPAGDVYAPAPRLAAGQSLFFEAELASYPSQAEAEAGWRKLSSEIRLAGLEPSYEGANSSNVRLRVGPLTTKAAVDALCVELTSLGGPCRIAAPVSAVR